MQSTAELWSALTADSEKFAQYVQALRDIDGRVGSFLSFSPQVVSSQKTGSLSGIPVGVKDNIAVEGQPLTCGSRILENLISPYSATAIQRLVAEGALMVGKTNLDEFGMGSSCENSALGNTSNPWNLDYVAGGSSGGSAAAVAAGLVPLALGSDTGGSVRQPASFCGVYGLKPTYGSISRSGLTAYASSLEVIGPMARDLQLLKESFRVMAGLDSMDQSGTAGSCSSDQTNGTIAVLELDEGVLDAPVAEAYRQAIDALEALGHPIKRVSLQSLNLIVPAYYTIATAEASANLARFNGIRYGMAPTFAENPAELMRKARHEGFGDEVKLRILLGTYVLRSGFQDQYYGQAQKVRTLIRQELAAIYQDASAILMPVFPTQAFKKGEGGMDEYRQKTADVFTCLANLAGLPALAIPTGLSGGLPLGMQLMAPAFGEERLFALAKELEKTFPLETPEGALDIGSLQ
ncbi:MAG: aspartyl/glutamyl-tRNA amidotransferase subunit A [Spirochaetales bacterium]|nr:aspartyl/glutamyl-tRNA amidotransferase subunit A [Spirochaetales bacterium]